MKNYIKLLFIVVATSAFSQRYVFEEATYKIDTLDINTEFSDFGASYMGSNRVVFSSPKKKKLFTRTWKDNKQPYLELYTGVVNKNGKIEKVKKFSEDLNSKYHEAQVAFTKNRRTVYFTSNNYLGHKYVKSDSGVNNLQLYRADVNKQGVWTNVTSLPFNNKNYSVGHPTLSHNDRKLYFVSDMPGGIGKTDIYSVRILPGRKYTKPKNLGKDINTKGKEMFPFMRADSILYFASDGRKDGVGELDVYASFIKNDSVKKTLHLPEPINSEKDDFAFVIAKSGHGFLSSNRPGGKGDDDIYAFEEKLPLAPCYQTMKGYVIDRVNGLRLKNAKVTLFDADKNELEVVKTDSLGNFKIEQQLDCGKELFLYGQKKRHLPDSVVVAANTKYDFEHDIRLELAPKFIKINPIYFDYDKSFIREDAAKELDKVVKVMKKYPTMVVEGGSHTDSRGRDSYNERLSSRRAKSTVEYIISKGISSERISSKGYGETQLVNHCSNGVKCSKEEHQLNRRTEFKILKY